MRHQYLFTHLENEEERQKRSAFKLRELLLVPFLVWLFINQSYLKELESTELWRNFEQEMTSNGGNCKEPFSLFCVVMEGKGMNCGQG